MTAYNTMTYAYVSPRKHFLYIHILLYYSLGNI